MAYEAGVRRSHRIVHPAGPLGHEALLTLARKVRAAAADSDPERLPAARRFSVSLDRHLQAEAGRLNRMVPAEARLLKRGQDRIRALAADLVDDAGPGRPVPRRGVRARAEELVALLSLQARDEHHALDRPAV